MEVVQANLEHVQDDMRRDNPELRQVRDEGQILQSNFGQLNDNLLLALEVPKLFIQLQLALSNGLEHMPMEKRTKATMSCPMSGIYLFKVAMSRE